MNTEVMFSSKSDIWATPQDFFDGLDKEFHFTLDACALVENAKCARYYGPEEDGLKQDWSNETVFCNPPYSDIKNWVEKAYNEAKRGAKVVMLIPERTDTRYFHDFIYGKHEIRFVRGRLKFGDQKNSAPFPSMVVVFNDLG